MTERWRGAVYIDKNILFEPCEESVQTLHILGK